MHEFAVAQGEFSLQGGIESDCAPLNGLVEVMVEASQAIHSLRDPTRGGMATVLWEIAQASRVGVVVDEGEIPIRDQVKAVCELLGFALLAKEPPSGPDPEAGRTTEPWLN
jgi:hydrogenase expression/formation protein HypE